MRGSERYEDKEFYKSKLKEIAPFHNPSTKKWWQLWEKEDNHDTHVGVKKWEELLYHHSGNNIVATLHTPETRKSSLKDKTDWQTRWTADLPIDELS